MLIRLVWVSFSLYDSLYTFSLHNSLYDPEHIRATFLALHHVHQVVRKLIQSSQIFSMNLADQHLPTNQRQLYQSYLASNDVEAILAGNYGRQIAFSFDSIGAVLPAECRSEAAVPELPRQQRCGSYTGRRPQCLGWHRHLAQDLQPSRPATGTQLEIRLTHYRFLETLGQPRYVFSQGFRALLQYWRTVLHTESFGCRPLVLQGS